MQINYVLRKEKNPRRQNEGAHTKKNDINPRTSTKLGNAPPLWTRIALVMHQEQRDHRAFREDDHVEDDLGPPNVDLRSSLRHLSPSGLLLVLVHRSDSGGAAGLAPSGLSRRNLGTYFPGVGAAAAAAGAAVPVSNGRASGSEGLTEASVGLPRRASLLCLSFSSSSSSLCLCFSAISANFAKRSASSFFLLSASVS